MTTFLPSPGPALGGRWPSSETLHRRMALPEDRLCLLHPRRRGLQILQGQLPEGLDLSSLDQGSNSSTVYYKKNVIVLSFMWNIKIETYEFVLTIIILKINKFYYWHKISFVQSIILRHFFLSSGLFHFVLVTYYAFLFGKWRPLCLKNVCQCFHLIL